MDFKEARDDGAVVASAEPYLITHFFTGQMLFLMPNQQCQSTEGKVNIQQNNHKSQITT